MTTPELPEATAEVQPGELVPLRSDATFWAKDVTRLRLGEVPAEAVNLNVTGKRVVGPVQGFGKLWQKTYRVELPGAPHTPAEVITAWKAAFASFWPDSGRFYGKLTGIDPGDVALLNLSAGGMKLSTGILVLYADDESFTFMTPQGHIFAGWITFSATETDGVTAAQTQVLLRANDPLYELAMPILIHRQEDRFWERTLANLAAHLGVEGATVTTSTVCVDKRRQWSKAGNIWHNAGIRSALYLITTPFRAVRRAVGRRNGTG
jgi:hypothetical protein